MNRKTKRKGKNTKNHANAVFPVLHKWFKNHAHINTNIISVIIVYAVTCQAMDTIAIRDNIKYNSEGVQYNLEEKEFVAVNEDIIKNTQILKLNRAIIISQNKYMKTSRNIFGYAYYF